MVDRRERATRKKRSADTEEETNYSGREMDCSVVNTSQIGQVFRAMNTAIKTQLFPSRKETPKTLIFAKTDRNADDIIQLAREAYWQGNTLCKRVIYRSGEDADSLLSSFRNDYYPRIAVTWNICVGPPVFTVQTVLAKKVEVSTKDIGPVLLVSEKLSSLPVDL